MVDESLVRQIATIVRLTLAQIAEGGWEIMSTELTTRDCDRMMAAAEEKAKAIGIPMVIAIVDAGGNLKAFKRMDDALLISVDIAQGKAYTACSLKASTRQAGILAQPGAELFGLEATNKGRIVTFGGGFPIKRGSQVVGGIGVSGGPCEQDELVAQAGLDAL